MDPALKSNVLSRKVGEVMRELYADPLLGGGHCLGFLKTERTEGSIQECQVCEREEIIYYIL